MQRYLLQLARALNRPFFEVATWPADEIALQMAYDLSQSADFQAACAAQAEEKRQTEMTPQQRMAEFAQSLGLSI